MKYIDYIKCRDLSWQVLIRYAVSSLPVSVTNLCRKMQIRIALYESKNDSDGYSVTINGFPVIFVNMTCSHRRQRFTAAHELGHILLGHTGMYRLVNREPSKKDNYIEQMANVFASRLLAPSCILHECGLKTAEDVAELCDISLQSAAYRIERMNLLEVRNKFYSSPLERQVLKQFADYIASDKL